MAVFGVWLLVIAVELVTPRFITPASDAWEFLCTDTFSGEWVPDPVNGNKMCTRGPVELALEH